MRGPGVRKCQKEEHGRVPERKAPPGGPNSWRSLQEKPPGEPHLRGSSASGGHPLREGILAGHGGSGTGSKC